MPTPDDLYTETVVLVACRLKTDDRLLHYRVSDTPGASLCHKPVVDISTSEAAARRQCAGCLVDPWPRARILINYAVGGQDADA